MTPVEDNEDVLVRLMGPAARDNPYPIYAWLREHAPVYRSATTGAYLLSRYEDCERVLRNHEDFPGLDDQARAQALEQISEYQAFRLLITAVISTNPPQHTRMRYLFSRDFTARRIEALRPRVEWIADRLLTEAGERLTAGEVVDFHSAVSVPMPMFVIAELIGMPEEDRADLAVHVPKLMNILNPVPTPEEISAADEAYAAMGKYYDHLVAERRRSPRDDLVSALAARHEGEDQLTDEEIRLHLLSLWVAGFETTASGIDNALLTLLDNPGQAHWLRDTEGTKAFVNEALRYDGGVQAAPGLRFAAADTEFPGGAISAGSQIHLLLGSANRDPAVYPDPDRFDPSRSGPTSLIFGHGIHFCTGAGLARLNLAVLLSKTFSRLRGLRLAGEPQRRRLMPLRDFDSLPVTL